MSKTMSLDAKEPGIELIAAFTANGHIDKLTGALISVPDEVLKARTKWIARVRRNTGPNRASTISNQGDVKND